MEPNITGKGIIDSCASTYYVNSETVKRYPDIFTQTPIPPHGIQVGGKLRTRSTAIATFQLKVGLLPPETITAYVLPLGKFDFVLGLPWLEKHNPHVDWKAKSYEFNRNGRTYLLHPARPPPNIRIVTPEEFRKFRKEKDVSNFLLIPKGNGKNQIEKKDTWTEEGRERIVKYIRENCKDLLRPIGTPANLEEFKIDTGDHEPIRISPRPYSPLDHVKIHQFIDENLANGVLSHSDSPWSAPLVLAAKPDGTTRVCVDYRALNQITKRDAHPLPRIDESLLHFFGCHYFTSLDLKSGYWQIPLELATKLKTAFSCRQGHFHWNVLPFGLTNAPAGFQRRMNRIL